MQYTDGYMPLLQRITAVACYKCAEKEAQVLHDRFGDPWASGQITEVPVPKPEPAMKPSSLEKHVSWQPARNAEKTPVSKHAPVMTHLGDIDDCSL